MGGSTEMNHNILDPPATAEYEQMGRQTGSRVGAEREGAAGAAVTNADGK